MQHPVDAASLTHAQLEQAIAEQAVQVDVAEHRLLTLIRELERRGPRSGGARRPAAHRRGVRARRGELLEGPSDDAHRDAGQRVEAALHGDAGDGGAARSDLRGVELVTGESDKSNDRFVRVTKVRGGRVRLEVLLEADEAALLVQASTRRATKPLPRKRWRERRDRSGLAGRAGSTTRASHSTSAARRGRFRLRFVAHYGCGTDAAASLGAAMTAGSTRTISSTGPTAV